MEKFKYAFIMNSRTLTPDTYMGIHENSKNYYVIAGVHSVQMASELAKDLSEEGFFAIDLCGAFDEKKTAKVSEGAGGKAEVRYARYSPLDAKRMDALDSMEEYGLILMDSSLSETEWLRLESDEYNTAIAFVHNLESACSAAVRMVKEGIAFLELCRWFDEERAQKIIDAIEGAVPVGYCG